MIITDIDAQRHIWARATRDQRLVSGEEVKAGRAYFILSSWESYELGPCKDHDPGCECGGLEVAGLQSQAELFCAADFEPVTEAEANHLMARFVAVGCEGSQ